MAVNKDRQSGHLSEQRSLLEAVQTASIVLFWDSIVIEHKEKSKL